MYYIEISPTGEIIFGHEYGAGLNQKAKFPVGIQEHKWYHLVLTRDGNIRQYKLYINGELYNQTYNYQIDPGTLDSIHRLNLLEGGPTSLYLGALYSSFFLEGWLDEVRLWSTVRTQQEIVDNMYKR